MAMRAFQRAEPSHCRECSAPVTEIYRDEPGALALLGCHHSADGYTLVLDGGSHPLLVAPSTLAAMAKADGRG